MFNGIIKNSARFVRFDNQKLVLDFDNIPKNIGLGDSIAVNGVCLTVVLIENSLCFFDCLEETLSRTNLGSLVADDVVNIEFPITLNDMISGHLVSGHVDFVSELLEINNEDFVFSLPNDFAHLVVSKGSITINGVALTSCDVSDKTFSVYLIPETLNLTNLSQLKIGSKVNIELDMIARYVDRILTFKK